MGDYSRVNGVLIFGIIITCAPVIGGTVGYNIPWFLYPVGIVLILIGTFLSVVNNV